MTQTVLSKNPHIHEYENPRAVPPMTAAWPLPPEAWKPYLDSGVLITFAAVVPLKELVNQDLCAYVNQAFGGEAEVQSAEFRVVGHEMPAEFDEAYIGDVIIQVTGELVSAG